MNFLFTLLCLIPGLFLIPGGSYASINQNKPSEGDSISVLQLHQQAELLSKSGDPEKAFFSAQKAFLLAESAGLIENMASSQEVMANIRLKQGETMETIKHLTAALKLYGKLNNKAQIASTYKSLGDVYDTRGQYDKAIHYYSLALKYFTKSNVQSGIGDSYLSTGKTYHNKGNYDLALENYVQAHDVYQKINDQEGIADSYNTLGNVYADQLEISKAREYYLSSLELSKSINYQSGIGIALNNIGITFQEEGKYKKALEYYLASLKIDKELENEIGIADSYTNLGVIYSYLGNNKKALEYYDKSLEIRKRLGDKVGLSLVYINMAESYLEENRIKDARREATRSLEIGKELKAIDDLRDSYLSLSMCDSAEGKWRDAYLNFKEFKRFHDSIFNAESVAKRAELFTKYEGAKKEAEIKLLKKEKEAQAAIALIDSKRNNVILFSVLGGLLLVILFSLFLYNRWRVSQKQKMIIESQKSVVDEQKMVLEGKNKDITDSITYALRIQQAKLPGKEEIYKDLPLSFILFKPKDIVSGDFYFYHKTSKYIFLAAGDCTGHGVPGAFMSLISSDKLEEAVKHSDDPGHILQFVNKGIKSSMGQTDTLDSTRDGLDIALCRLEIKPDGSLDMIYSGANRPLWIIREGKEEIEEIKATKKALGGITDAEQIFDTHSVHLVKGDTFYIFTDGYADTFGGEHDKKLTIKRFRQLLLAIRHMPVKEQGKYLEDFLDKWKGGTEQIDDILVMGVRV